MSELLSIPLLLVAVVLAGVLFALNSWIQNRRD